MNRPRLAIRADGGSGVGAGHVMRCAALADAWARRGGIVEWFCRPLPPLLQDLLARRGIAVNLINDDWTDLEDWCRAHRGSWVCVDGYGFADGARRVRAAGARALVIDDDGRRRRCECDALLNQVIGAERLHYDVPAGTRVMLGTKYCLLRDEIVSGHRSDRDPLSMVRRVFVSFGGHDAHGLGARVAAAVASALAAATVDVAAGVVGDAPSSSSRVMVHAGTDLGRVMQQADIAVAAAGSVCWELAYLGIPALLLVVADNQEPIARGLHDAGAARSLGWFDRVSDEALTAAVGALAADPARAEMSRNGRQLVDGRGAARVVEVLLEAAA